VLPPSRRQSVDALQPVPVSKLTSADLHPTLLRSDSFQAFLVHFSSKLRSSLFSSCCLLSSLYFPPRGDPSLRCLFMDNAWVFWPPLGSFFPPPAHNPAALNLASLGMLSAKATSRNCVVPSLGLYQRPNPPQRLSLCISNEHPTTPGYRYLNPPLPTFSFLPPSPPTK